MHRKLKTQATIDGEEMSQIIEQLVDNWLSEHSNI
ncbi:MAG: plasmid partition protein ParG [Planktothrix sp.]